MLVISRKVNERIQIVTESGERIIVNVAQIVSAAGRSPKVRIGFQAARSIRIDKEENLSSKLGMTLISGEVV